MLTCSAMQKTQPRLNICAESQV